MEAKVSVIKTLEFENGTYFHGGEEMFITDKNGNEYIGEVMRIRDDYVILTKVTKNDEPLTDDVVVMYDNIVEVGYAVESGVR